jgi:hypothetical protein
MVTKKNASRLARRVERIKSIEKGTLASVVEIGRELIAAEAECEHGSWANWLRTNFSWSVRTALRYRKTAEFSTACDDCAYGPDVTLGDMDISLSALYFVATMDKAVAKSIALKAIGTRVTLNVAREIAAQKDEGEVDLGEDEQTPAPAAEDDDAAPGLADDDRREADDGLPLSADKPLFVALSLLANELDQTPENFIAAAKAFDPDRLRRIVSQLERVLQTIAGDETIRQKADRADTRLP